MSLRTLSNSPKHFYNTHLAGFRVLHEPGGSKTLIELDPVDYFQNCLRDHKKLVGTQIGLDENKTPIQHNFLLKNGKNERVEEVRENNQGYA